MLFGMTYEEFLRQVRKAGLSVSSFAELMKMNRASLSNYSKQREVPDHLAIIAVLLAECFENSVDYKPALDRIDISRKKPRGAALRNKFGGDPQQPLLLRKAS